jgi:hypothetical protein
MNMGEQIMKFLISALTLAALASPAWGSPHELEVEHRRLGADTPGRLVFNQEAVQFIPARQPEEERSWHYRDIRELRIEGDTGLRIITYKDRPFLLNRPEVFRFNVVEGMIEPELVEYLRSRVATPLVSAVFSEPEEVEYRVPARHRHALGGGCDGVLLVTPEGVYFDSDREDHSRFWPLEDIEGLGTVSRFDLRLTTHEGSFHFRLKEPLSPEAYDRLWQKVFLR